jgi:hypothetical protein
MKLFGRPIRDKTIVFLVIILKVNGVFNTACYSQVAHEIICFSYNYAYPIWENNI